MSTSLWSCIKAETCQQVSGAASKQRHVNKSLKLHQRRDISTSLWSCINAETCQQVSEAASTQRHVNKSLELHRHRDMSTSLWSCRNNMCSHLNHERMQEEMMKRKMLKMRCCGSESPDVAPPPPQL
ncbi:hypothetical protein NQZ68_039265 [Dissostichus eleginoides]|nr:hypothetical protein NQZ68_039265 [Dissostichus eleginoides]